jgi:tRNA U55 pseudouridine synthase TruB
MKRPSRMQFYYKPPGETMKQFISRLQENYREKITYVAKLDPMASGIVPIITEEQFAIINMFTRSDKVYTVNVVFGISTDSTDALGVITEMNKELFGDIDTSVLTTKVSEYITSTLGSFHQEYHYFSSKRLYARYHNKEDRPVYHNVKLYNFEVGEVKQVLLRQWIDNICKLIQTVDLTQDFRQKEIITQWKRIRDENDTTIVNILPMTLKVSSGFFVRQLIADMSKFTGIPMFADDIVRVHCSSS